jgi:hypothetical protein
MDPNKINVPGRSQFGVNPRVLLAEGADPEH